MTEEEELEKEVIAKKEDMLQQMVIEEQQLKDSVYDYNKLRRTLIKGLPCAFVDIPDCDFIRFQRSTGKRGISMWKKQGEKMVTPGQNEECEQEERLNIRGDVWKYLCRVDQIKQQEINKLMERRRRELREQGTSSIPVIRDAKSCYLYYLTKDVHMPKDVEQIVNDLNRTVKN